MPKAPFQQKRQAATDAGPAKLENYNQDLHRFSEMLSEKSQKLLEKEVALQEIFEELEKSRRDAALMSSELDELRTELREIFLSSRWKLSVFVRWMGEAGQAGGLIIRLFWLLVREPAKARDRLDKAARAYRFLGPQPAVNVVQGLLSGTDCAETDFLLLKLAGSEHAAFAERVKNLPQHPLISILLTIGDTAPCLLAESVDSVVRQIYPNWELCIVCTADNASLKRVLARISRNNARIRVDYDQGADSISDAGNRALAMATGGFVARLFPGDLLQPQALFRLAESILEDGPDIIYSDEAIIRDDRSRVEDYIFRPAFSIERLRSNQYIVNLTAFRRGLVNAVGGFDPTLRQLVDYDLLLRVCEKGRLVSHIPETLYLRRRKENIDPPGTPREIDAAAIKVIRGHLSRLTLQATVHPGRVSGYYVVEYPVPIPHRIAVIIPTKNHAVLVRQCIESLENTITGLSYDLVIVDHSSDEPDFFDFLSQLGGRARVIKVDGAFNFSAINNFAVSQLDQTYTHYLFCNNDIQAFEPGWLTHLMGLISQDGVGIVGAKLLYRAGGMIQHAGVCIGLNQAAEHYGKFVFDVLPDGRPNPGYIGALVSDYELSAVTGACLLIESRVFEMVGGFDERLAVGFGDVDLCLRVRNSGYRVLFSGNAQLVHHESYSRGKSGSDPHPGDSSVFKRRWHAIIAAGDPFYNPNLTATRTNWEIEETPPRFALELRRRVVDLSGPGGNGRA